MAVLVEAISIIIRLQAIEDKFPGGFNAFNIFVPNPTLCWDDKIARVGFMAPPDANKFIEELEANGLRHLDEDERSLDFVWVDQLKGQASECDWITIGKVPIDEAGENRIGVALYAGSEDPQLSVPDEWTYQASLSQQYGVIGSGGERSLKFLRHEDGNDVFFSTLTDCEVYVGRP